MGVLPTIAKEASLGYSVMAYQSAQEVADHLEAGRPLLAHLKGATSQGRGAAGAELAQKAKFGYCPGCTGASRAAVPPTYELGEFAKIKARGLGLRKDAGLWAARRYAAYL